VAEAAAAAPPVSAPSSFFFFLFGMFYKTKLIAINIRGGETKHETKTRNNNKYTRRNKTKTK
jgi:hypothetical protein